MEGDQPGSSSVPDALPTAGADTDWREFRARLVASTRGSSTGAGGVTSDTTSAQPGSEAGVSSSASSGRWAHSLPGPEKGCLLLAHPLMFHSSQEYFFQAVILILEHTAQGSYGIILNRPSAYKLSELSLTHPLPAFDDSQLYVGGDVGGGEITLLHRHPWVEGSSEVVKGVHVGGIHAAQEAITAGARAQAADFRLFAKYAGWGPGQLDSECKRGVWFTVAASPSVILTPPATSDGSDTWHGVLHLMGGDYATLSDNVIAAEARRKAAGGAARAAPAAEGGAGGVEGDEDGTRPA